MKFEILNDPSPCIMRILRHHVTCMNPAAVISLVHVLSVTSVENIVYVFVAFNTVILIRFQGT